MNVNVGTGGKVAARYRKQLHLVCNAQRFLHIIVHIGQAMFLLCYPNISDKPTAKCMSSSIRTNSNLVIVYSATA